MKLTEKVWNHNKKVWHEWYAKGYELHHCFGRVGINKCCFLLFAPAQPGHQDNYKYVKNCKITYLDDKKLVEANYVRNIGCKKTLRPVCSFCILPLIEDKR